MACIGLALSAGDNDTAKDVKEEIAPPDRRARFRWPLLVAEARVLFCEIVSDVGACRTVVDEQKSKCRKTLQENNTTEGTTSTSSGSSGGLQRRATLHLTTEIGLDRFSWGEPFPLRECNTLPSDAVVAVGVDEGGLIAVAPVEHFVAGLEDMPPGGAEAAGPSGSGEEASQVVPDDAEEPASQMPEELD